MTQARPGGMDGRQSVIDLHCHSRASDGHLAPAEVVARAAGQGVRVLALTDHDTLAGVAEAAAEADRCGISLIPAVECSCTWQGRELHIVGLAVDPNAPALQAQLRNARDARWRRMQRIAQKLAAKRIPGVFEEVVAAVGDGMPTRAHVARVLYASGHVHSLQQAFDRYIGRGKPAWCRADWPTMEDCVAAIREAGGQAVLAHPLAYGMTGAWLRRTLMAFGDAGGEAVEVVCGSSDRQAVLTATGQALRAGLKGSVGSDFHNPENPWIELGRLRPLPPAVIPVWHDWSRQID